MWDKGNWIDSSDFTFKFRMWTTYLRLIYHFRGREKMKSGGGRLLIGGYPSDSLDLRIWSDVRNIMSDHVGLWRGHMFSGRGNWKQTYFISSSGIEVDMCNPFSNYTFKYLNGYWLALQWSMTGVVYSSGKGIKADQSVIGSRLNLLQRSYTE